MHANGVDASDLKPGAFQLIDDKAQGRTGICPREDVLVHKQAPDEVLILPRFAYPCNLQEENTIVIKHIIDLRKEAGEVPDANMLRHLETGDLLISTRD